VNAKQAYEVQWLEMETKETNCWYKELWNWKVPLKIKVFIFLMLEQRILTWENLVKRGFLGPSRCVLCGKYEEFVYHLFMTCKFTKVIWTTILRDLKLKSLWEGGQLVDCLKNCIRKEVNWKEITCYICWEVWKHRNSVIFEDHPPNLFRVCGRIF
jgi:ferredoxin